MYLRRKLGKKLQMIVGGMGCRTSPNAHPLAGRAPLSWRMVCSTASHGGFGGLFALAAVHTGKAVSAA
jgi:hypothetical protein